jgi:hypothetical protein
MRLLRCARKDKRLLIFYLINRSGVPTPKTKEGLLNEQPLFQSLNSFNG